MMRILDCESAVFCICRAPIASCLHFFVPGFSPYRTHDRVSFAPFAPRLNMSHLHTHDGGHSHSHGQPNDHGHTHEVLDHPGKFASRDLPTYEGRNWKERAFTVGIGGPVYFSLGFLSEFFDRLTVMIADQGRLPLRWRYASTSEIV